MPGAYHDLKASYSVETNEGFARLSRMANQQDRQWPPNSGNVNEDIMLDAVYGGGADPDVPNEYEVYTVDWLQDHPEEFDQATDQQRTAGEPIEDFTQFLDRNFEGWIYHKDRGEVYLLRSDTDSGQSQP